MAERIGAEERQELYRRRREEAISRLVAEAEERSDLGWFADDETEASPYRQAEELARDLHRGR